ncbi:MAG TPA: hypothetical protein VIH57_20075 [Bacteroidales bacterium]
MKVFVASSSKVEVNGETVYAIVDGMGGFKAKALKILSDNGIQDPKPGHWYSQQAWLNAFKSITEQIGNSTLYSIGQKIPENAKFPPEISDIHKALSAIDVAYQMNHRNGEIGNYIYQKTGERSARLVCTNPYPDEFDKGIIVAMAKKFRPPIFNLQISIDESQPIRMKGGDSTTFNITW